MWSGGQLGGCGQEEAVNLEETARGHAPTVEASRSLTQEALSPESHI